MDIRPLYESVLIRGEEIVESFRCAYNLKGDRFNIAFNFIDSPYFNAWAEKRRKGYGITFHSSTVLLLRTLFDAIFADASVIPEIGVVQTDIFRTPKKVPFIYDTSKVHEITYIATTIDPARYRVAEVYFDFCMSFILAHEIAHVIGGHTDSEREFIGFNRLMEFGDKKNHNYRGFYLQQSWEYDADSFAANVVVQYLESLIENMWDIENLRFAFWQILEKGNESEQLVALLIVSLFAMYTYLANAANANNQFSVHPHNYIRANIAEQAILTAIRSRKKLRIDEDITFSYYEKYFDQFASFLEKSGLSKKNTVSDELFDTVDHQTALIANRASRLRRFNYPWMWMPVKDWIL